jgi:AraC-like DNA-binding protein
MCPRNLHKHTVKRLGVSPHRLIENWKMERAGRLICRHSIAYTARRLGYRNETTLRHTFRRRFQMPPGEWKRRAEGMKAEEIRAAIKKVLGLDYDKTIT